MGRDRATHSGCLVLAAAEAGGDGFDASCGAIGEEPVRLVQFGREPHLGVDDAVARQVDDGLGGDASRCSGVCITASVCSNVAKYWSRSAVRRRG